MPATESNSRTQIEYRPIPEFLGYFAGSDGIIYSQWMQRGLGTGLGSTRYLGPSLRPLRMTENDKGYLQVKLYRDGRQFTRRVNRLVLLAFKEAPSPKLHACHKDGNRHNNRPDNLRWGTARSNQADRITHGTSNRGERHPHVRLTESQVRDIRLLWKRGLSVKAIAAKYNIGPDYAREIGKGKAWAWLKI